MRYSEIVNEAISSRPYRLGAYVSKKIADLKQVKAELETASELIDQSEAGFNLLDYFERNIGPQVDFRWLADMAKIGMSDQFKIERFVPVTSLLHNLESYNKYGRDFLHYVMNSWNYVSPVEDTLQNTIDAIPQLPEMIRAYGFNDGEDYSDDDEYMGMVGLLKALNLIATAMRKAEMIGTEVRAKLGEVYKMSSMGHDWEKYRPEHGDLETLYHASAYCTEIVRDGFQAEPPEGRRGLGNYGSQDGISFTHSLEIAHTISRSLKELWMIAHGQLTARHIIGWIKAEGIDKKQPDLARVVGIGEDVPNEDPRFGPRHRLKQLHELKSPVEIAKLYRVYLAMSEIRSDPVMTYPEKVVEMMAGRKKEDIGILACECALSKEDRYYVGESEFRLPADRIKSIKRIV